ncbi:unnamed protein product [Protopolystoma xenopodis]|uniref:Uncharacterized protein n=1 Tax=Protopolystoma xenopodis TaxID=117903 RepID=A0A3S5B7T0_9PLAT|nr:unnamed protein product [Protopolystoma xenopodis]
MSIRRTSVTSLLPSDHFFGFSLYICIYFCPSLRILREDDDVFELSSGLSSQGTTTYAPVHLECVTQPAFFGLTGGPGGMRVCTQIANNCPTSAVFSNCFQLSDKKTGVSSDLCIDEDESIEDCHRFHQAIADKANVKMRSFGLPPVLIRGETLTLYLGISDERYVFTHPYFFND